MTQWRNFSDTVDNAARGIFSIDAPAHRAKRAAEAQRAADLDAAYAARGLDRKAQYAQVARLSGQPQGPGIWPTSTWQYAAACEALDRLIFKLNETHPIEK